jgi:TonB family protein
MFLRTPVIRPILFIFKLLIFIGCGSSAKIPESEFEDLRFLVGNNETGETGYTIHISGYADRGSALYKESLKRLKQYSPEQVLDITESELQGSPVLTASIVDDPRSVNRVLWLFGTETYKNYHLDYREVPPESGYVIISSMPELAGDIKDLQKRVRYPSDLAGLGVEGRVDLQFIVNEYGEVEDPKVIQGLHESADREAIRVIRETKFRPGMVNGLPVRVQYKMPVFFRYR